LKDKPDRTLTIDMELPFSKIGPSLVEDVERLAPFGAGNPAPVFCTHDVRFAGRPRAVGESGAHLRGVLTDGSRSWPCVGFGMGASAAAFGRPEARLSAAYRVKFDTFRSAEVVELELLDVRSAR
jgi:single-stranded-DNA-specific exonuclease